MLTKVTVDYHGHHGAYLAKSVAIAPFDSAAAIALPCFLLVIAFLAEPLPTSLAPFGFGLLSPVSLPSGSALRSVLLSALLLPSGSASTVCSPSRKTIVAC